MTPPGRNPLWDLDAAGVQLRLADDGRLYQLRAAEDLAQESTPGT